MYTYFHATDAFGFNDKPGVELNGYRRWELHNNNKNNKNNNNKNNNNKNNNTTNKTNQVAAVTHQGKTYGRNLTIVAVLFIFKFIVVWIIINILA